MNKIILILTSLIVLVFSGCSITNGTPKPDFVKNKAIVFTNDSLVNVPKANIVFRQIDNQVVSTFWTMSPPSETNLKAGKHSFVVAMYSDGYAADAYIEGILEANKVYEIYAYSDKNRIFEVNLSDVTDKREKIISTVKIQGTWHP